MAFVLEGPCDRSLARSAWDITIPRNRPVGYGLILAGVRTSIRRLKYWSDQVSEVRTEGNPAVWNKPFARRGPRIKFAVYSGRIADSLCNDAGLIKIKA